MPGGYRLVPELELDKAIPVDVLEKVKVTDTSTTRSRRSNRAPCVRC